MRDNWPLKQVWYGAFRCYHCNVFIYRCCQVNLCASIKLQFRCLWGWLVVMCLADSFLPLCPFHFHMCNWAVSVIEGCHQALSWGSVHLEAIGSVDCNGYINKKNMMSFCSVGSYPNSGSALTVTVVHRTHSEIQIRKKKKKKDILNHAVTFNQFTSALVQVDGGFSLLSSWVFFFKWHFHLTVFITCLHSRGLYLNSVTRFFVLVSKLNNFLELFQLWCVCFELSPSLRLAWLLTLYLFKDVSLEFDLDSVSDGGGLHLRLNLFLIVSFLFSDLFLAQWRNFRTAVLKVSECQRHPSTSWNLMSTARQSRGSRAGGGKQKATRSKYRVESPGILIVVLLLSFDPLRIHPCESPLRRGNIPNILAKGTNPAT